MEQRCREKGLGLALRSEKSSLVARTSLVPGSAGPLGGPAEDKAFLKGFTEYLLKGKTAFRSRYLSSCTHVLICRFGRCMKESDLQALQRAVHVTRVAKILEPASVLLGL